REVETAIRRGETEGEEELAGVSARMGGTLHRQEEELASGGAGGVWGRGGPRVGGGGGYSGCGGSLTMDAAGRAEMRGFRSRRKPMFLSAICDRRSGRTRVTVGAMLFATVLGPLRMSWAAPPERRPSAEPAWR